MRGAALEISALNRLIADASKVLVPELARLARTPQARTAVATAVADDADIRRGVLIQLAAEEGPDHVLAFAAASRTPWRDPAEQIWQSRVLQSLVDSGRVDRARRLWLQFTGLGDGSASELVYDGGFRGLKGSAPFAWRLSSGPEGVVETGKPAGLLVEYYGRARVELASQLLVLTPGRYRLTFGAQGNAPGENSRLAWTIGCPSGGKELARIAVVKVGYATRKLSQEFQVPKGCAAQWLRLVGIPAEFPNTQSLTITGLGIEKVTQS
jgi:hypothetical protein